jgi:hypothetical protein
MKMKLFKEAKAIFGVLDTPQKLKQLKDYIDHRMVQAQKITHSRENNIVWIDFILFEPKIYDVEL